MCATFLLTATMYKNIHLCSSLCLTTKLLSTAVLKKLYIGFTKSNAVTDLTSKLNQFKTKILSEIF